MDAGGFDVLARLVPSMALILGALLAVRWWARRGASQAGAGVRVLTRTGLTRGAVVAVVEAGDRRFLVGASEHGVNLLGELDGDALVDDATTHTTTDGSVGTLAAMDAPHTDVGPRMGPIDRLRRMTVRTHVERPIRVPDG